MPTDTTTAPWPRQPRVLVGHGYDAGVLDDAPMASTVAHPAVVSANPHGSADVATAPDASTLVCVGLGLVLCATAMRLRGTFAFARSQTRVD